MRGDWSLINGFRNYWSSLFSFLLSRVLLTQETPEARNTEIRIVMTAEEARGAHDKEVHILSDSVPNLSDFHV